MSTTTTPPTFSSHNIANQSEKIVKAWLAIQTHSQMILQQPDLGIIFFHTNLNEDQMNALISANYWNGVILDKMIATNFGVIDYAAQFKKFHATLVQCVEQQDYTDLADGLKLLLQRVTAKTNTAKNLVDQLSTFQTNLSNDGKKFTKDFHTVKQKFGGEEEFAPLLKILTTVHHQLNEFITSNQDAVSAIPALVSAWGAVKSDLQNVLDAIEPDDNAIPWTPEVIVAQLNAAYSDWDDALTLAMKLQPSGQVSSKYKDAFKDQNN